MAYNLTCGSRIIDENLPTLVYGRLWIWPSAGCMAYNLTCTSRIIDALMVAYRYCFCFTVVRFNLYYWPIF
jgi:hypothetical protein